MLYLYLDFDGCLHSRPLMGGDTWFCWADRLAELVAPHEDLKIVLATSWAVRPIEKVKSLLPSAVAEKVIGSTYEHTDLPGDEFYQKFSRFQQILIDVHARGLAPSDWVSLDDDARDWPAEFAANLVHCHPHYGLSDEGSYADLRAKLSAQGGSNVG